MKYVIKNLTKRKCYIGDDYPDDYMPIPEFGKEKKAVEFTNLEEARKHRNALVKILNDNLEIISRE